MTGHWIAVAWVAGALLILAGLSAAQRRAHRHDTARRAVADALIAADAKAARGTHLPLDAVDQRLHHLIDAYRHDHSTGEDQQ